MAKVIIIVLSCGFIFGSIFGKTAPTTRYLGLTYWGTILFTCLTNSKFTLALAIGVLASIVLLHKFIQETRSTRTNLEMQLIPLFDEAQKVTTAYFVWVKSYGAALLSVILFYALAALIGIAVGCYMATRTK